MQLSSLFAGAGIRGGRAIGATNRTGSDTVDYGWSRQRYIRPEDGHYLFRDGYQLDNRPLR